MSYGSIRLWRRRTRRIQQTSLSGLPNFVAFSSGKMSGGYDVIVAVVARYEEILATLPGSFTRSVPSRLHAVCLSGRARLRYIMVTVGILAGVKRPGQSMSN
jgi:hypothetical protein